MDTLCGQLNICFFLLRGAGYLQDSPQVSVGTHLQLFSVPSCGFLIGVSSWNKSTTHLRNDALPSRATLICWIIFHPPSYLHLQIKLLHLPQPLFLMMMPRNVPPTEVKVSTQRQVMAGVPTFPNDSNVLRQPPHSGFVPTCGFPGSKRPSAKDFGHLAVQKVINMQIGHDIE